MDLIKEVYINPIRSVIVVDDEYPTVSELLDGQSNKKTEDINRLKEVITMCRDRENGWTLDIDNGQSNVREHFSRLSHSDLLILDYHLEGSGDDGKGYKALNIIDSLVKNQHFNLIVVHTKGYKVEGQDAGDFNAVFLDIVLRLFGERTHFISEEYSEESVLKSIDEWADDDGAIIGDLHSSITTLDYLSIARSKTFNEDAREFQPLKMLFNARPKEDDSLINLSFSSLCQYVLNQKKETLNDEIGDYIVKGLNWCKDKLWIKTSNSFIVVVGKNIPTAQLPEKLLESLNNWNPHPHALLLSKFRHLVDEHGFRYVDDLINRKYVQAGWLQDFVQADDSKWVAQQTSERLLNSMAEEMIPEIGEYARTIRDVLLKKNSVEEILKNYHNLNITDKDTRLEIAKNINAYTCSKPVVGSQLVTGHIIEFDNDKYVCLTPACDLVPSQLNDWKKNLGYLMPFKLVKLWPSDVRYPPSKKVCSDEKLLSKLNANEHIVFEDNNEIKCYTLLKADGANPQWEQAFAHDKGELLWDNKTAIVYITRIVNSDDIHNDIGSRVVEGRIVTQLRYEYAINLLQKFGVTQSRVGLDFVEFR